jgi:hypothetical protein
VEALQKADAANAASGTTILPSHPGHVETPFEDHAGTDRAAQSLDRIKPGAGIPVRPGEGLRSRGTGLRQVRLPVVPVVPYKIYS